MSFLPKDYKAPKSNNYLKLKEGENRIRILSRPILGWEDWTEDKKPVRYQYDQKPRAPICAERPIRHFWSFIVWNYLEQAIQIMHITQATIRSKLQALSEDQDWGPPFFYDIKIFKKGDKTDTEYNINQLPHKEIDPLIIEEFKKKPCNLEALFKNEDPFADGFDIYTPCALEEALITPEGMRLHEANNRSCISPQKVEEINEIFSKCPSGYGLKVIAQLKKADPSIDSVENIPSYIYERIKEAALSKMEGKS